MANFIFDSANDGLNSATLDLSQGTFYAHLVTTRPLEADSMVSDLVLPASTGYAPTVLTGMVYTTSSWTFNTVNFVRVAFPLAPVGAVICKQTGGAPASSDPIVCYSDFGNTLDQVITLASGTYALVLNFGVNGLINFQNRYLYTSGAYIETETYPKGLIFLIGSKNNTQTFGMQSTVARCYFLQGGPGFTVGGVGTGPLDRNPNTTSAAFGFICDFLDNRVKPGQIAINGGNNNPTGLTIHGSNTEVLINSESTRNESLWTSLGSIPLGTEAGIWTFGECTTNKYWRYIRLLGLSTYNIRDVEFYNSSILSPTLNIS